MKKPFLLFIFIVCVLFESCQKREKAIEWNVDTAFPLAYGVLSIHDLLPDTLLYINPDSSINLRFETTLLSLSIDSLASIPDTTFELAYALPLFVPITVSPGQVILNNPEENKLDIDGAELTEVFIKNGKVNYRIESTIPGIVIYTYTIPSAIDAQGFVFQKTITLPAATTSTNSVAMGSFDLAGYAINLRGANGNKTNTLQTTINAKLSPLNVGNITVTNQDTLYISNTISEIKIERALGYFGQHDFQLGPESVYIDFFRRVVSGNFQLDQLNAQLTIENGIGADAFLKINQLFSRNNNASPIALQHTLVGTNHVLNRAYRVANTLYPNALHFSLNTGNSNLQNMLQSMPDSLGYDVSIKVNPLGNVSAYNDFVFANSPLKVLLNVDMPLNIIANQLKLADTLNLDFNNNSTINYLKLFFEIENGFPMSASIKLLILDGNNMISNSVLIPGVIGSGAIGTNNKVIEPSKSYHELTLDAKDIENIQRFKKIKIQVQFDSPQTNHLYIYDFYKLTYSIRAQSNIKIKVN